MFLSFNSLSPKSFALSHYPTWRSSQVNRPFSYESFLNTHKLFTAFVLLQFPQHSKILFKSWLVYVKCLSQGCFLYGLSGANNPDLIIFKKKLICSRHLTSSLLINEFGGISALIHFFPNRKQGVVKLFTLSASF